MQLLLYQPIVFRIDEQHSRLGVFQRFKAVKLGVSSVLRKLVGQNGTFIALRQSFEEAVDLPFHRNEARKHHHVCRPGEVDGVHYYFVTKARFEEMIAEGAFLEYDAHAANYYGTPRDQAEEKMEHGTVLLDIEPNGAKQVKESAPEAILIFIMPPDVQELERRLRGRGDTPEHQIVMRMERAVWEMEQRSWYDHVVVNDDAERCAEEILNIIAE